MCGRYTLHHDKEVLKEHFGVAFRALLPCYNLAPTEHVRFIFSNANEQRQEGGARWGLVPHWSKTGTTDMPLFNARSETVLEKPAFRGAFIRGRCLIPASGWYEWRRDGGGKQPYYLRPKTGEPLAFAGLFDVWRGEGDTRLVSCTILTTAASEQLNWLHERMPVIMDYEGVVTLTVSEMVEYSLFTQPAAPFYAVAPSSVTSPQVENRSDRVWR